MNYKCLSQQVFQNSSFKIVPIRMKDRWEIMNWRNDQLFHLRQTKPLTKNDQEKYFKHNIFSLFEKDQPDQILFSFLKDEECIGYGGLVYINWNDRNAEISFLMNTKLEQRHFGDYWSIFLGLLEEVAFNIIQLHKIYVYAFDLRPHLYNVLETNNYLFSARLKEHVFIGEKYVDVIIYHKINETRNTSQW